MLPLQPFIHLPETNPKTAATTDMTAKANNAATPVVCLRRDGVSAPHPNPAPTGMEPGESTSCTVCHAKSSGNKNATKLVNIIPPQDSNCVTR